MARNTLNRRTAVKAGLGSLGVAALAGMPSRASAKQKFKSAPGMRPLYQAGQNLTQLQIQAPPSETPSASVRALRRLTYGYRREDLVAFEALGGNFDDRLEAWVDAQLNGYQAAYPPVNDPGLTDALTNPANTYESLDDSLETLWAERVVADPGWPHWYMPLVETQLLAMQRAVYSEWQLAERLADFWHTHFSVQGTKFEVAPVFVHYDRDVIRPHMLGNFRDMLEAVTRSTAMMYYLSNVWNSKWGPNENFAREVQELHTLGAVHSWGFAEEVDIPAAEPMPGSSAVLPPGLKAGYSEADVLQVTLSLTGWTVSNVWTDGLNDGTYTWYPEWHDESTKRVLGVDIASSGEDEFREVLDLLAVHPNTARYVCAKLCRRFLGDEPPDSLVEAAATLFNDQWQAPDQLKQVIRFILLSNEFKSESNWGEKIRQPFDVLAGTARSCGGFTERLVRPDPFDDWQANALKGENYQFSLSFYYAMGDTGSAPYTWVTPDGMPEYKAAWLGASGLVMGWKAVNLMFSDWAPNVPLDGNWHHYRPIDVAQISKSELSPAQRTANSLVDYWVERILGYDASQPATPQLDPEVRSHLVSFMQQDAAGPDVELDLDQDGWSNTTWEAYVPQRLQTLVAGIAMLPENLLR